ncbi:hypothetical protein ABRZ57_12075, partial [Vibrio vulnificus]
TAYQLALVSAWYWIMVLFLAKQIITLYHAAQKSITKDQHALGKAGIYIALEVLLVLLLGLISVGAGAAVKAAATSQKVAKYSNMFAKAVSHNKAVQNMRSGLNAVLSAFEQLLALFEKLKKIAIARSKALSTTFTGWTNRTVKKSVSTPKRDDKPPRCRVCGKTGHDTKPVRAGRLNYA